MRTPTDTFAFFCQETDARIFSGDPFFTQIVRGASEEIARQGKQLILMLAPEPENYERIERFILAGHVDGVIVGSMHGRDPFSRALLDAHVPLVASGTSLGTQNVPCVDVDQVKAVHAAVTYLLMKGRRHIATITGPMDMTSGHQRNFGYLVAMEEAGESPIVANGSFTWESGIQAMQEIIASGATFDAVFAASDLMALGAMRTLQKAGMRVPEDVAVIGFDDIDAASLSDPPLTTIRQPVLDSGVALARKVIKVAEGEDVEIETMLPTELIIRESA